MERLNHQIRELLRGKGNKMIIVDMIWGETAEEVQAQLDTLVWVMDKYRLKISEEKSVVLLFERDKNITRSIVLNMETLKLVKHFTYSGREISANHRIKVEISKSLQKT